jgi:microcystin-dependent protein
MPVTINGTTGIVSPNFIGNGSVPTGSVYHFATSTAPTGFLFCNGEAVPNGNGTVQGVTADFSALYAILGTTYGVAGTLPDLQGVFLRGTGSQTIAGITYSGTLGTKQNDSIIDHTHDYTDKGSGSIGNGLSGGTQASSNSSITRTSFGVNTPNNSGAETRPANIALLPCIKY